jgi:enamine deaminase RidA (YjgF/YER057c/UK114 family)
MPKDAPLRPGISKHRHSALPTTCSEALAEAGAAPEDLLKTTIYVVGEERSDLVRAWTVVSERLGRAPSTLLGVSFLGYPDQLVEIEAIARAKTDQ